MSFYKISLVFKKLEDLDFISNLQILDLLKFTEIIAAKKKNLGYFLYFQLKLKFFKKFLYIWLL